jgi:hypothetical protein
MKNVDTKFYNIFFNEILLKKINNTNGLSSLDIETFKKIFIFGRSEKYFLDYIENNLDYASADLSLLKKNTYKRNITTLKIMHYSSIIFENLTKQNIDFIPLKGAQLIYLYNYDFSYRSIRDLDLLIQQKDIYKTVKALYKMGFYFASSKKLDKNYKFFIEKNSYCIEPLFNDEGVCIELHHKIFNEYPCNFTKNLWQSSKEIIIGNIKLRKINPELLCLHFIYHASSKQGFDVGIQVFFDLYGLIRDEDISIQDLIIKSKELNLESEAFIFIDIFKEYNILKCKKDNDFKSPNSKETLDIAKKLLFYNTADNHSLKLYRFNLYNLIIKNFSKKKLQEDTFLIKNQHTYLKIFLLRVIKNSYRYFYVFVKLLFNSEYRKDNKLTANFLKKINKL